MTIAEARKVLSKYRINQLAEVAPYEIEEAVILALRILERVDEEFIRKELLNNIGWFIQAWEDRPKSGKGNDRSDLLRKLSQALIQALTKE